MAIEPTDLKVFRAQVNDDSNSNGGAMSAVESVSGAAADVWPAIQSAERAAGSIKYRKVFHKNDNADDLPLNNSRVALWEPTPGDDQIFLMAATQSNTQGDLTGSEPLYGAGVLDATVLAGATSIDVLVEDGSVIIFRDTELIRISDMADLSDTINNEEWHTISGAPSILGNVVTINLAAPLSNGYSSANTNVASAIEHGVVAAVANSFVPTSVSGTIDSGQVTAHNQGAILENWTLTFTSATAFDVVGAGVGSVGAGNISSAFAPVNPDTSTPYLTINAAAWGGTWAVGETVTFATAPSAVPVFEKRVVPAGAAAISGNNRKALLWGETA